MIDLSKAEIIPTSSLIITKPGAGNRSTKYDALRDKVRELKPTDKGGTLRIPLKNGVDGPKVRLAIANAIKGVKVAATDKRYLVQYDKVTNVVAIRCLIPLPGDPEPKK